MNDGDAENGALGGAGAALGGGAGGDGGAGAGGNQAARDLEKFKSGLKWDQYYHSKDQKVGWREFIERRRRYMALNNVLERCGHEYCMLSLMAQMNGTAQNMTKELAQRVENPPQGDGVEMLTYPRLVELMTAIFEPPAEVTLKKQRFKDRKQGRQEDIIRFLAAKRTLYNEAYPTEDLRQAHMETLMENCTESIWNREVKIEVTKKKGNLENGNWPDWETFVSAAVLSVATERDLVKKGWSNSSENYDGLAASSQMAREATRTFDRSDGPEPMDIDQVHDKPPYFKGECLKCGRYGHMKRHCPSKKRDVVPKPKKGATPGKFAGKCHKCGRRGHKQVDCRAKKSDSKKVRSVKEDGDETDYDTEPATDVGSETESE